MRSSVIAARFFLLFLLALHGGCSAPSESVPHDVVGEVGERSECKPAECDDGNPCTTDSCNPQSGCEFTANDLDCDDGNACTEDDVCSGGWCAGSPLVCDDDNICTQDGCNPESGCVNTSVAGDCDDGDVLRG